MSIPTVKVKDKGAVRLLCLHNPERYNSLHSSLLDALGDAFKAIEGLSGIRGVIIYGSGDKAFASGADISEMQDMDRAQALAFAKRGQSVFQQVEHCRVPVLAAVQGYALGGGCELAMAFHMQKLFAINKLRALYPLKAAN